MNKTEIFIKKAILIHHNRYDYSKVEYIHSKEKVEIVCKEHASFFMTPNSHLKKQNCPNCVGNKQLDNRLFYEKSKEIFGDKYDYSMVKYINNKTKVELICNKHGSFLTRPDSHLSKKNGCPKCSYEKNSLERVNINWKESFEKIHGNKYDYSKVIYKNSKIKVEIICKEHGSFLMKPNSHINKQGCKRCAGFKIININDFIKEAIEIHNNQYDYSKINYLGISNKIEIICKKHGSFLIKPKEHIHSKQGCPKCGKESMSNISRKDINILLEQFCNINNSLFDYSNVKYKNNKTKIDIICKKHGSFLQTPKSHLRGDGCPKCNSSKGERKIVLELDKHKTNYITQNAFSDCLSPYGNKLKFDFYLPEHNICIEYDGEQHFRPIDYFGGIDSFNKQKLNDDIKNKYCESHNIKLIRIPFDKYDSIDDILISEINI